jgi:hypothetical protein
MISHALISESPHQLYLACQGLGAEEKQQPLEREKPLGLCLTQDEVDGKGDLLMHDEMLTPSCGPIHRKRT